MYRPPAPFIFWDNWMFPHEGVYHLFYLERLPSGWGAIGHATSRDLVHWTREEPIAVEEVPGTWEASLGLTGTVVRHDGMFWMFYGGWTGEVYHERIGALVSPDLRNWHKHPNNPLMEAAPPYHAHPAGDGAPPSLRQVWWRDPVINWREDLQCYEALVGARLADIGQESSGACIGRARSRDLVHWEHVAPLADVGRELLVADVPDVFEIGGTWYLTFNTHSKAGRPLHTPRREHVGGTYYMIGPSADGPFEFPDDPCLLGSGLGRWGPNTLATLAVAGDGTQRVAYHWMEGPYSQSTVRPAFALPRYARQNRDLTLSLCYHDAVEGLEVRRLQAVPVGGELDARGQLFGEWEAGSRRLAGRCGAYPSAVFGRDAVADLQLSCRVDLGGCETCGVQLRVNAEAHEGLAVALDRSRQEVTLAPMQPRKGNHVYDRVRWVPRDWQRVALRVIARAQFIEVYVDDELALCDSLSEDEELSAGVVGHFVGGGSCVFEDLRLAELEPLLPAE